jgi:mercuric ion transport protein
MNEGTRAAAEQRPGRSQAGILAALAAVAAAVGASLCCIGPLLFVTLGVGAGLASTFEPLRPLFTALAATGLAIGFYVVYGRKPAVEVCGPGETCAVPRNRRRDRVVLWVATVTALLFWSFNYWSLLLL